MCIPMIPLFALQQVDSIIRNLIIFSFDLMQSNLAIEVTLFSTNLHSNSAYLPCVKNRIRHLINIFSINIGADNFKIRNGNSIA